MNIIKIVKIFKIIKFTGKVSASEQKLLFQSNYWAGLKFIPIEYLNGIVWVKFFSSLAKPYIFNF